jgi:hypothetical protein
MKIFNKTSLTFLEKMYNGFDHLVNIQKTTKLKIEVIIVIEILQVLYYIFFPSVRNLRFNKYFRVLFLGPF